MEPELLTTVAMPSLETVTKPLVSTYTMQIVPLAPKPEPSLFHITRNVEDGGRIVVAAPVSQQRPWEHTNSLPTHVPMHEKSVLLNTFP